MRTITTSNYIHHQISFNNNKIPVPVLKVTRQAAAAPGHGMFILFQGSTAMLFKGDQELEGFNTDGLPDPASIISLKNISCNAG